jgi:hypothetical protein
MHPDIRRARALLLGAIQDLTPERAETAVDGKWSIAGILEHLHLSYSRSAAAIERRREKGAGAPVRARTLKQQLQQFVVVTLGYLPTGREAPKMTVPSGRSYGDVLADLERAFSELDESLAAAANTFGGSRPVLDHPLLGPFSVDQWRKFHLVHTRHHVKQIHVRRAQRS